MYPTTPFAALSWSDLSGDPLVEVALALGLAAVGGALFAWARQSTLPAYLLVGAVAGPAGLGLIGRSETMRVLAEIGVLVMLFLVGVKLDLRTLARVGRGPVLVAVTQMAVVGGLGFALALGLGYRAVESTYIGSAAAISSTVIVVTLLGDRKELDSLHGKLAVAILIVQDIFAVCALFVLPTLDSGGEQADTVAALALALGRLGLFLLIAVFAFVIFDPLSRALSRSGETSFVFLVSWMLGLGIAGALLGLGEEAGAFAAGVMVSTASHGHIGASRLAPVRDFLVPLFFLTLGSQVSLEDFSAAAPLVIGLFALVVVVKPAVLFFSLARAGFRARASVLTALSMGQTSEFSLLLFAAGAEAGQLAGHLSSAIAITSFASFVVSIFMAANAPFVYQRSEALFKRFERKGGTFDVAAEAEASGKLPAASVLVFGVGRIGAVLLEELRRRGVSYLGLDFDPEVVKDLRSKDPRIFYGDAEDPDLFDFIELKELRVVVSTARSSVASESLVRALRQRGFGGIIVVAADDDEESRKLYELGADLVLVPYRDAAELATTAICEALALVPPSLLSVQADGSSTRDSGSLSGRGDETTLESGVDSSSK